MQTLHELVFGRAAPESTSEKDLQDLVRLGRIMQDLVASEAWKEYEELLLKRQHAHTQELMMPIREGAQVYLQESNKGAIHALAWASGLPSAIIAQSKEILAQRANNGKEQKHAPLAP